MLMIKFEWASPPHRRHGRRRAGESRAWHDSGRVPKVPAFIVTLASMLAFRG